MVDLLIKGIPLPKTRTFKIEVYPNGTCTVDDGGIIPISATALEIDEEKLVKVSDVKKVLRSGVSLDTEEDQDYVCGLIDELDLFEKGGK